ncbi:helix-turn-helix domain-containing protein [Bradyrhizobium sp. 31Argb]|uniref:helix-turn-helix domain-containing protein n=1 Tax=Bradyrhizobium sp. 31Argb TaxID=3141247 RepID=UPI003748F53A
MPDYTREFLLEGTAEMRFLHNCLALDWIAAARMPSLTGHPQTERPVGFTAVEINCLIMAEQAFRRYRIARPWSNQILDAMGICAKYYGVTRTVLLSDRSDVVEVRQKVMVFVRVVTGKNFHEIGDKFERSHSVVIHACKKYERAIRTALTPVE